MKKIINKHRIALYLALWSIVMIPAIAGGIASGSYSLDEKKWERVVRKADYTEREPKEKKDKNRNSNFDWLHNFFEFFAKYWRLIVYPLVILALAFVLYKILRGSFGYMQERVRNKKAYAIEELDDHIHDADLDAYLQNALKNKDFRLAVRLQYLILIKLLSDVRYIFWKKDKTNGDYLKEMRPRPSFLDFFNLTVVFEGIWYGRKEINEARYYEIENNFMLLKAKVKGDES